MTQIRQIVFNSYQDCFAVATDQGIQVFNCRPLVALLNLKVDLVGSIKCVALLGRSNLIAMVSAEPRAKFSNKTVMVYDALKEKFIAELTVGSPVLNLAISSTKLVVVQAQHIHVFNLESNFSLIRHEETGQNPGGLVALSPSPKNEYLVFPSLKPGSIQVVNLQFASQKRSSAPSTIFAHESAISKIAIDNQATKIATGSVKGTVIRIFDTHSKAKIFELRRGAHAVQLFCFRFSPSSSYLACCSDKGTIHVFPLTRQIDDTIKNTKKIIDHVMMKDERRSAFQFTMPHPEQIAECAFLSESVSPSKVDLMAVTKDGMYYHFYESSPKPQGFELIFNLATDQDFWCVK
ncbi:unnamed protein product [Bursaphelenchus xylophilus]|uniref:(pine wood nematode) hypothetical protein n=1 Tax=Bursaphelenchus xylophilus TaxID=6326 RepID=A0A1I7SUA8_BURXY|nr:unnamed protein product [Bursaphelenchus xylophilus]CAG9107360.1 unnamed protein product [Bursaphelenchus xylophilus]